MFGVFSAASKVLTGNNLQMDDRTSLTKNHRADRGLGI
jgi:hypothetical protein